MTMLNPNCHCMNTQPQPLSPFEKRQQGLSLIELMISITIGLVLLTGLVTYFVNASSNQRELLRSAQQIENGRYALDSLIQDINLAGFYGAYYSYATPGALPDPCDTTVATLQTALGLPVQGYAAASLSSKPSPDTNCAASSLLTAANLAAGSDILVVRYADTAAEAIGSTPVAGQRYLLSNSVSAEVQTGTSTLTCTTDVAGVATAITRKCKVPVASDACNATCTGGGSPAGDIRKLVVRVYFVAPCSVPSSGSVCNGTTDDGGNPIPTLKRLELGSTGFTIVPIAEGVEYMKIQYGVDNSPNTANALTGLIGDGVPDTYVTSPTLAEFANTVSVRVDLLVRNPEQSAGYSSSKTYNLGVDPTSPGSPLMTIGPLTDSYRRHVYAAESRLVNLSSRREIP